MWSLIALIPQALPCAGLVTIDATSQIAASDAQQAILTVGDGEVSAEYRVRYTGNADDFAWIIPVPGKVETVEEGSDDRFEELEALTAPGVGTIPAEDDAPGCGCGAAGKNDLAERGGAFDTGTFSDSTGVSVVGTGYAGAFQWTILEATEADGLVQWLTDRGYDTSVSAPSIADYVEDPAGFSWVAVQLVPEEAATPNGGVLLSPLRITWSARDDGSLAIAYPARMARTSMLSEVRLELWVVAGSRVEPGAPWTSDRAWDAAWEIWAEAGETAEDAYTGALREVGGMRPAVAGVWGGVDDAGRYVTRYDTIVAPAVNAQDLVFAETGDRVEARTLIGVPAEDTSAASVLLLPLALTGWALRRARRPRR